MAVLTVRNLPDEVYRALRMQAARHGRSSEAEVREIIAAAVVPSPRVLIGDALASLGRELALSDDEIATLDAVRDRTPATPLALSTRCSRCSWPHPALRSGSRSALRGHGRERPRRWAAAADGYIAATAAAHSFAVATRNVARFADTGVELINPWQA